MSRCLEDTGVMSLAFRYTMLAALGLTLVGCTRRRSITENVNEQLRSGATHVDIGRTGDFAWDDMFVFGPYYPKDGFARPSGSMVRNAPQRVSGTLMKESFC
jgi:hypothetical protein